MSAAKPKHWLMKSEPETFSIDDLKRKGQEPWDGVRNYQARNFMRDGMRPGDKVFFYHSNCAMPGIVGLAEVATDAYPDPSQFNPKSDYFDPTSKPEEPRWMLVEVKFVKTVDALTDMALVRKGNRLSVMPVSASEWRTILALE